MSIKEVVLMSFDQISNLYLFSCHDSRNRNMCKIYVLLCIFVLIETVGSCLVFLLPIFHLFYHRPRSRERGCLTAGQVAGTSSEWQLSTPTGPEVSPRPADTSTPAEVRHTLCVCERVFVCSCVPLIMKASILKAQIVFTE